MHQNNWAKFVKKYGEFIDLIKSEFDKDFYLNLYQDVAQSSMDAFAHYIMHGAEEGRLPNKDFVYANNNKSGYQEFIDFVFKKYGLQIENDEYLNEPIDEDVLRVVGDHMDVLYYETQIKNSQPIDPVRHYIVVGEKNNLNPHRDFNVEYFSKHNEDVKSSGINMYYHYLKWGKNENRRCKP